MESTIYIALMFCAFFISAFSLVISINNYIDTKGMQNATHTVQMMPAESLIDMNRNNESVEEDASWTMDDDEIKKINEANKDIEPEEFII